MASLRARILARTKIAPQDADAIAAAPANESLDDGLQPDIVTPGPVPFVGIALEPEFVPSPGGAYAMEELVRFNDAMFVQVAYRSVLRRDPDPSGFEHYLRVLRAGASKDEIVHSLLHSEEGRAAGTRVTGLRFRSFEGVLRLAPWLGRALRAAVTVRHLPEAMRRQRAQQAELFRLLRLLRDSGAADADAIRSTIRSLGEGLGAARAHILTQQRGLREIEARHRALEERLGRLEEKFNRNAEETRTRLETKAGRREITERTNRLVDMIEARSLRKDLEEQSRRMEELARILDERKRRSRIDDMQPIEAIYASLEDRFRGTRAEIKERQRVYIPCLREANLAQGSLVIDLGCGRGEWLELLREEGFDPRGVEINREFLNVCRESGLNVVEADCLEYLRASPSESAGALTLFHVIEHLPMRILIDVLGEAHRVLKPGGLLIVETPNPDNVVVGACTFYTDPTHQRPLPRALTSRLFEAKGFAEVAVLPLHPVDPDWLHGATDRISLTINHYFYGAQDYAVLGRKP
jgi:O-antigen chain-terminating methyltransferase